MEYLRWLSSKCSPCWGCGSTLLLGNVCFRLTLARRIIRPAYVKRKACRWSLSSGKSQETCNAWYSCGTKALNFCTGRGEHTAPFKDCKKAVGSFSNYTWLLPQAYSVYVSQYSFLPSRRMSNSLACWSCHTCHWLDCRIWPSSRAWSRGRGVWQYHSRLYRVSTYFFLHLWLGQIWLCLNSLAQREDYAYHSFKKLIHWCPSVKKFMDADTDNYDMALACQEVSLRAILYKVS